jgi:hypothetical protein
VLVSRLYYLTYRINHLSQVVLGLILATIVSGGYLPSVKWFLIALSGGSFGWSLPHLNPLSIYFYPELIGREFPKWFTISTWIIFFIFTLLVWVYGAISVKEKTLSFVFLILISTGVFGFIVLRDRGWTEYSSWKSISYLVPFSIIVLFPMLINIKKIGKIAALLCIGISLTTSTSTWWGHSQTNQYFTKDLEDLGTHKELRSIKSLNIDIQPNFYTMGVVSVIHNPQLSFVSNSYFTKSFNETNCTLVLNWDERYTNKVPINNTYSLVNGTSGCS